MSHARVRSHPFLDWPAPIPFAHRGGASEQPENTLAAFAAAVELGFRYLETDVRATRDGVLLAFHDPCLDRVTDRTGRIEELPWAEVRRARVDGREPIAQLAEVLDAFPDARINIDAKHDAAVEPLVATLRAANALDRVCVASFSEPRLRRLRRELGPTVCTALGPVGVGALRAAGWGAPVRRWLDAPCAQVPSRQGPVPLVDRRTLAAAHRARVAVQVWTVDDPAEIHRLLDLGVDGLMTDRPTVLKDVLVARGQWVS